MRDDKARDAREPAKQPGEAKPVSRDVGHALRSVYVETVNEEVPMELLDLLGKLD
ncbi:NepR family anti-sigma factor [Sphingomonas sp.]|uniref:NepR family anti-sigma factor n=1 Tax=Sphingomonas sp. TaxID=28214 RepID=UPI003B00A17D